MVYKGIYITLYSTIAIIASLIMLKISYISFNRYTYQNHGNYKKFWSILLWLIIISFSVFREIDYGVGGIDAIVYKNIFYDATMSFSDYVQSYKDVEFLYIASNWIIYRIFKEYRVFLVIYYTIITLILINFSEKWKISLCNILPIFCFNLLWLDSFNTQRNTIAIMLSIFIVKAIEIGKLKKAFILTCLLIFIHLTSIVFLIPILGFYIIDKLKKHKLFFLIAYDVISSAISFILLRYIAIKLSFTRYVAYFNNPNSSYSLSLIIGLAVVVVFLYSKKIKKNHEIKRYIYLYLFFLPIVILQFQIGILYRIMLFSIPIFYIILSEIFLLYRNSQSLFGYICRSISICYLALRLYSFMTAGIQNIIPYHVNF